MTEQNSPWRDTPELETSSTTPDWVNRLRRQAREERKRVLKAQSRDRNGIALPDGWALYFDGELVFSCDEDKWESIGEGVEKIMGVGVTPELCPFCGGKIRSGRCRECGEEA